MTIDTRPLSTSTVDRAEQRDGKNVPTSRHEKVAVRLEEIDGVDEVVLIQPAGVPA